MKIGYAVPAGLLAASLLFAGCAGKDNSNNNGNNGNSGNNLGIMLQPRQAAGQKV